MGRRSEVGNGAHQLSSVCIGDALDGGAAAPPSPAGEPRVRIPPGRDSTAAGRASATRRSSSSSTRRRSRRRTGPRRTSFRPKSPRPQSAGHFKIRVCSDSSVVGSCECSWDPVPFPRGACLPSKAATGPRSFRLASTRSLRSELQARVFPEARFAIALTSQSALNTAGLLCAL